MKTNNTAGQSKSLALSQPKVIKKLINSLMYLFRFSCENELAFLLGYPNAESNQTVLELWVTDTLKYADWVEPQNVFSFLVNQLKSDLSQWQEVA